MAKYLKPTVDTKFHIDFAWWQQKSQNLRAFLRGHTCEAAQELVDEAEGQTFDWVSPDTGEVFQIDWLWYVIREQCKDDPEFLGSRIPLTSAIFRAFMVTDNAPLSPVEIRKMIGTTKSAEMILKTIGSRITYKGIKPVEVSG